MSLTRADLEALEALERRLKRAEFSAANLCRDSPPQLRCATSASLRKVVCSGRRSGKTRGVQAPSFLEAAMTPPYAPQLFVAMTRRQAKEIIWDDLLTLNHEYGLGGVANLTDLTLSWPDRPGSRIMLAGANNERETAKIRGKRFKRVGIDEFQGIPDRIAKPLLLDVIGPTLVDFQGALTVSGTPGPVPIGFFFDLWEGRVGGSYERHHWTLLENPYLHRLAGKSGEQILADVRAEHGWTEDDATYRREYLGEWVYDRNALVFRWDVVRNGYATLPEARGWRYVLGVDLGFDDADALAVLGWHPGEPTVYLVEEHVVDKQGVSELGALVAEMRKKYQPVATWVDPGGLGRKIIEELRRRWHVPCEAAEKVRKLEHIELLNDAMRTGRFKAPASGRFAEDCMRVQWDMDARARGVLRVSDAYHSDITDAVLYAYRACRGYLFQPDAPPPPPDRDVEEERRREELQRAAEGDWWEADMERMGWG